MGNAPVSDKAADTAMAFFEALRGVSPEWVSKYRIARRFLTWDPLERLVPEKLLLEGVQQLLSQWPRMEAPLVVFMNRGGHGDGARVAARLMPLLSRHWHQVSLVLVSFNTPDRGLGDLVRGLLVKTGAENGILTHVAAYNRPAEGLKLSVGDMARLLGTASLVISFASDGEGGLVPLGAVDMTDPLIAASHLSVLSYPDPEGLVAELGRLNALIGHEPGLDAIRFWVQTIRETGAIEDVGTAALGEEGDAHGRLWPMIENARRQRYRVLVEPVRGSLPAGAPLVCQCRSLVAQSLGASAKVDRIVPAGARLVAVAHGRSNPDDVSANCGRPTGAPIACRR